MTIEEKVAIDVIKVVLKPLVNSIGNFFHTKVQIFKNDEKATEQKIIEKLKYIQMVKTIWQSKHSISIFDFYYPLKVQTILEELDIQIIDDFNSNAIILLSGTVGQGKSIFLRHLCLSEYTYNKKIPIFLECRHLEPEEALKEVITRELDLLGFDISKKNIIDALLLSGRFFLALDGFDELKESSVGPFLRTFFYLQREYPSLKIVITSRPGTDIFQDSTTEVFELKYIQHGELPSIIKHLCSDDSAVNIPQLISDINASPSDIKNLLNTPLLISMLLFIYNATEEIPQQFSEFYKELFRIILVQHDQTKPGFRRELKSGLSDSKLQELFRNFCFITKVSNKKTLSYNHQNIIEYFQKVIDSDNLKLTPESLLYDISMGTNLIIKEGSVYTFIHKSIQEYFTAEYLDKLPEEYFKKIVDLVLTNYRYWEQELEYLEELNWYRYVYYFKIPIYNQIIKNAGITQKDILESKDIYVSMLQHNLLNNFINASYEVHIKIDYQQRNIDISAKYNGYIFDSLNLQVLKFCLAISEIKNKLLKKYLKKYKNDSKKIDIVIPLYTALKEIDDKDRYIIDALNPIERQLKECKIVFEKYNEQTHKVDDMLDLLMKKRSNF